MVMEAYDSRVRKDPRYISWEEKVNILYHIPFLIATFTTDVFGEWKCRISLWGI